MTATASLLICSIQQLNIAGRCAAIATEDGARIHLIKNLVLAFSHLRVKDTLSSSQSELGKHTAGHPLLLPPGGVVRQDSPVDAFCKGGHNDDAAAASSTNIAHEHRNTFNFPFFHLSRTGQGFYVYRLRYGALAPNHRIANHPVFA